MRTQAVRQPSAIPRSSADAYVLDEDDQAFVNIARNSFSARCRPSSVKTTDFALLAGLPISPLSCKRELCWKLGDDGMR